MKENREGFTIVLVDDDIESMKSKMKIIRSYLENMGLELILLEDEQDGDLVEKYLDDYDVDIIVTDNSMTTKDSGLKLVEKLKDTPDLYILFYSAVNLTSEDYKKLGKYLSVVIISHSEIVDDLKNLIDKVLLLEDLNLSENEKIILEKLKDCNIQENILVKLDQKKIFEIFEELLIENNDFSLSNLWTWVSRNIDDIDNEILEKIGEIFSKVSFDILAKLRYRCSKCGKKYVRWPQPNPRHREKDDLACQRCETFNSVRPIV